MKLIIEFPHYFAENGNIYSMWPINLYANPPTKPRKLKPWKDKDGYNVVGLYRAGKKYTRRVGRLILQTYRGPCPKGMEMCHGLNGKSDDSLANLSWNTHSKNMGVDKLRDNADSRGENNAQSKLNEKRVLKIRTLEGKMTEKEIAKKFSMGSSQVHRIIRREAWAWLK